MPTTVIPESKRPSTITVVLDDSDKELHAMEAKPHDMKSKNNVDMTFVPIGGPRLVENKKF